MSQCNTDCTDDAGLGGKNEMKGVALCAVRYTCTKFHVDRETLMAGHMEGAVASAERAARQTMELLGGSGS